MENNYFSVRGLMSGLLCTNNYYKSCMTHADIVGIVCAMVLIIRPFKQLKLDFVGSSDKRMSRQLDAKYFYDNLTPKIGHYGLNWILHNPKL